MTVSIANPLGPNPSESAVRRPGGEQPGALDHVPDDPLAAEPITWTPEIPDLAEASDDLDALRGADDLRLGAGRLERLDHRVGDRDARQMLVHVPSLLRPAERRDTDEDGRPLEAPASPHDLGPPDDRPGRR